VGDGVLRVQAKLGVGGEDTLLVHVPEIPRESTHVTPTFSEAQTLLVSGVQVVHTWRQGLQLALHLRILPRRRKGAF
jgi:hypothetical protein